MTITRKDRKSLAAPSAGKPPGTPTNRQAKPEGELPASAVEEPLPEVPQGEMTAGETKTAPREASGRFAPGHKPLNTPGPRSPVERALAAAGSSVEEAARVLAKETIAAAKLGDAKALERLDRWLMPAGRLVPAARGSTPAKRAASIVQQLARGDITPAEAGQAVRAVEAHARITEDAEAGPSSGAGPAAGRG